MSARHASAERRPAAEPTPEKQKPHLELIEGGKKDVKEEPSWNKRAASELKIMDILAKEVKNLEKEILEARSEEARAGLVEALEEIEEKLRETRKEWKQIVAQVTAREPSQAVKEAVAEARSPDVAEALRAIHEIEPTARESSVMVSPEYQAEVQKAGEKIIAPENIWETPPEEMENDARAAAAELKESEPPGMNLMAFEIMEKNELPPPLERKAQHDSKKLERDAERADREVVKLEGELQKYGVDPEKLATSPKARFMLSFRTLWNGKLDNLMTRYKEALEHSDRLRIKAQIMELAPRDPMRSITANTELIREYINRRAVRRRRDAAYTNTGSSGGSAPRLGSR